MIVHGAAVFPVHRVAAGAVRHVAAVHDGAHVVVTFVGEDLLGFIPLSGKMYITRIRVCVLCTMFVKKPGGSQKNAEYDTDLGVTIEALLEMMPKLQRLDISFFCEFERKNYPGWETTTAVLEGTTGSLLEFLYPIQIHDFTDPPKPKMHIGGNVAGRPIRAAKEQGTRG